MTKTRELVVATTNQGKLTELLQLFDRQPVTLRSLADFPDIAEPPETGTTFAENARQKALYYGARLSGWVLADDSGLAVDAINGQPGVHSARFAGVTGPDRDKANNRKLLEMLALLPGGKRGARFCCSLCLVDGDDVVLEVAGEVPGVIVEQPRGVNGFGYDPIFLVDGEGKTAAELPPERKNAISHRGLALAKLLAAMKPLLASE